MIFFNRLFKKDYIRNYGYCLICEKKSEFYSKHEWLRDNYHCRQCNSIPRDRALINTLNIFEPEWRGANIHESSPGTVSSFFIRDKANKYSYSHFIEDIPSGVFSEKHAAYCQDLRKTSFSDDEFDILITQDVLEHIFQPEKVFREIRRILKPGGCHVFTVPLYKNLEFTKNRAIINNKKEIEYLVVPEYHGNPVDSKGSLVTIDWGRDVCDKIFEYSGMTTTIYLEKNHDLGLSAEFLETFISRKPY